MRIRLAAVLAAAAPLVLGQLAGLPAQAAADRDISPRRAGVAVAVTPQQALDRARAVFADKSPTRARRIAAAGGQEATLLLRDLARVRDQLAGADRRAADALLARPSDGGGGAVGEQYAVPEATPLCDDVICIHYVTSTADAPPLTDGDADGRPDSVQRALQVARQLHDTYLASGYKRPVGDGSLGEERTSPVGTDRVDVYLANIGNQGLYGYCSIDPGTVSAVEPAYCAIDDDFSSAEFGSANTPAENQRVTLAHEYFHAIQFAYDYAFEDAWFMEATATWAEDEVADSVNDNRQYLSAGQLGNPWYSLDRWEYGTGIQYGNWIFFRYLTERFTAETGAMPNFVLRAWQKAAATSTDGGRYSLKAVMAELAARTNEPFATTYAKFADKNRRPGTYDEGGAYPLRAPDMIRTLRSDRRSTGWYYAVQPHLTSATVRFKPGTGTGALDWALRVRVNQMNRANGSAAWLTVHRKDGGVSSSQVKLNTSGDATKVVGFSSRRVKFAELTMVNASTRTTCWQGDWTDMVQFSCLGSPRDERARSEFLGQIFRR